MVEIGRVSASALKNPPPESRPAPFWSWNADLKQDELLRQMDEMENAGIGGAFFHARGGLETEYLSEEWMSLVAACMDHGAPTRFQSFVYDENGWPSGFGNGWINEKGEEYQLKYLRSSKMTVQEAAAVEHRIACYSLEGKRLECLPENGEVIVFSYRINPFYVDNLDRKVVRAFLDRIYEAYDRVLTPAQKQAMAGFFTDEPQLSRFGIPWSFVLEQEYRSAYKAELLDDLVCLHWELGNYRAVRCRFWKFISKLFAESYMKQIYDWCEEHHWKITGHHVMEENYLSQINSNGAVMPSYQYYHIPGMDWLGRHIRPVTTPVQVGSVAAQVGQKRILSETFACCGWNVSFADLKWIYQWQMVHGMNYLCPHLEGYTLRGIRKRDYPASLFIQEPWWDSYRSFTDYVSRIGLLIAEGEVGCEVLVMHGIASAWMHFDSRYGEGFQPLPEDHPIERYYHSFEHLSECLDRRQVPYHYGDDQMMLALGAVEGDTLRIGKMTYRAVVLPQLGTLSSGQVALLREFRKNGGRILAVRNTVEEHFYLDGNLADDCDLLAQIEYVSSEEEAATILARQFAPVQMQGSNSEAINLAVRRYSDLGGKPGKLLYFISTDQENASDCTIVVPGAKGLEAIDANTGDFVPLVYHRKDGAAVHDRHFAPGGDLLLVVRDEAVASAEVAPKAEIVELGKRDFSLVGSSENLLTLEYCDYSVDSVPTGKQEYILSIQDRLLELRRDARVEMRFSFECAKDFHPDKCFDLLMEAPEKYTIELNGIPVENRSHGWLFDRAFERIDLAKAVRPGKNELKLSILFHQSDAVFAAIERARVFESEKNKLTFDTELEAIYLAGDFGVSCDGAFQSLDRNALRYCGKFQIVSAPKKIQIDRIVEQGYPFFSGSMTLETTFEAVAGKRYCLSFLELWATYAGIEVNGVDCGKMFWEDYAILVPEKAVRPGLNRVKVRLVGSLRNMLGPHHLAEGESYTVSPGSFYRDQGVFRSETRSDWLDDSYCFVRFGAR
ncbi:MAG: hypothetical protein PHS41_04075 [Victivallaceae bacterium]|nr:hypothetical protein [Victivallaceae bacterium]